jgi:hypothetical protein
LEIWATFKDNCLHPEGWLLVKSMLEKQAQVDPDEEVPMEDEDLEDAIKMVDRAHPQAAPITPFERLKVANLIGDEEADDDAQVLAKQVWEAVGRIEGVLHSLAQDFAILQGQVGAQVDSDAGALTALCLGELMFTDERLKLAFKSQLARGVEKAGYWGGGVYHGQLAYTGCKLL